jgi:hypothetical protein
MQPVLVSATALSPQPPLATPAVPQGCGFANSRNDPTDHDADDDVRNGDPCAESDLTSRAGALRNGNRRGNPNAAPRCGAKARSTGCPCRAPAMTNGRCRLHGGKSTGPRTQEGMARMAAAHITHGRYSAGGAPARAAERNLRVLLERSDTLSAATELREYLAPDMERQLDLDPPELWAPNYVPPLAFQAPVTPTLYNLGSGERHGGRRPKIPLIANWREAERALAKAEADALAPWKAAIAFARMAKREARAVRARLAAAKSHRRHMDRMKRETAGIWPRGETAASQARSHTQKDIRAVEPAAEKRSQPESTPVDINPVYLELALRAAGLRARFAGRPVAARPDHEIAPRDINPIERPPGASTTDRTENAPHPPVLPPHLATAAPPMGSYAPQASQTGRAAEVGEVADADPIQLENG